MSFEIEKKYIAGNFTDTFHQLVNDFNKYSHVKKQGFWWCNNYSGIESVLDVDSPKFFKKDVAMIKDIAEFIIPEQDFQYIRLRIHNEKTFIVTFKIKSLINKIEQNTEYEFEVDSGTFKRIFHYLSDTSLVFYYNIKESWEFKSQDYKIELSKFNDLKDAFVEIEVTGNNEKELHNKLNNFLNKVVDYKMKEEPRNYMELSRTENRNSLKNLKLSQYSRKAKGLLADYI